MAHRSSNLSRDASAASPLEVRPDDRVDLTFEPARTVAVAA